MPACKRASERRQTPRPPHRPCPSLCQITPFLPFPTLWYQPQQSSQTCFCALALQAPEPLKLQPPFQLIWQGGPPTRPTTPPPCEQRWAAAPSRHRQASCLSSLPLTLSRYRKSSRRCPHLFSGFRLDWEPASQACSYPELSRLVTDFPVQASWSQGLSTCTANRTTTASPQKSSEKL